MFYTTVGISFNGKKGSVYTVRFMNKGSVSKLVSMILASPMQVEHDVTLKDRMLDTQQRVERVSN